MNDICPRICLLYVFLCMWKNVISILLEVQLYNAVDLQQQWQQCRINNYPT